jgi:hypothetical protein
MWNVLDMKAGELTWLPSSNPKPALALAPLTVAPPHLPLSPLSGSGKERSPLRRNLPVPACLLKHSFAELSFVLVFLFPSFKS